ncbi:MAG: c-type cytochrome [Anaerolineales bacterium]|nr:c-type cytochrome [Anaerolineales bacterium]
MKSILSTIGLFLSIILLASCGTADSATPAATEPAADLIQPTALPVSFSADVQPILDTRCIKCHGVESVKDGLDLQTYEALIKGSRDGAVIVVGDAAQSKLADLIERGKMPKRGQKLSAEEIQIIVNWINQGALNN